MRIIDSKIMDEGPRRAAFILMELGEMNFDKYLQSSVTEETMQQGPALGQGRQGFHGGSGGENM